jgi:hypothetical protein
VRGDSQSRISWLFGYWLLENGGRMKLLEMMGKTTIVQKVLVVGSIVWILIMISKSYDPHRGFHIGWFAQGLIPIVVVWGAYWVIIQIIEKRKNK